MRAAAMPMNCIVLDAGRVSYRDALALQREAVSKRQAGEGEDALYLLEHPPVITIGRNADGSSLLASENMLIARGVELIETDRGGDATFHGPGQLVGYPILALEPERRDIGRYIRDLEEVLMRTLADFGVISYRDERYRGVWTSGGKIASVGVRIARWVTSHGFALNVATDLSYFELIHPCGIAGCRMTSMERVLGAAPDMSAVKDAVARHFAIVFEREMHPANEVHPSNPAREIVLAPQGISARGAILTSQANPASEATIGEQ